MAPFLPALLLALKRFVGRLLLSKAKKTVVKPVGRTVGKNVAIGVVALSQLKHLPIKKPLTKFEIWKRPWAYLEQNRYTSWFFANHQEPGTWGTIKYYTILFAKQAIIFDIFLHLGEHAWEHYAP